MKSIAEAWTSILKYFQGGRFTATHVRSVFDDDVFRSDYFKAINPHYQGYDYEHYREAQTLSLTGMVAANPDTAAILQALQAD